ncbi:hypothetical protein Tdes44962_MAKER07214 [Teratosphaeria destructans]|uniref:Uncharacterized protein n=1 Tax=Teratosphaeria destructans TaxID=418781 RepID=A0A9W7W6G8_9PEZI|nr:hypothetical protein Tdes44962_MAKER07214 [Teratosphaeria destructans]
MTTTAVLIIQMIYLVIRALYTAAQCVVRRELAEFDEVRSGRAMAGLAGEVVDADEGLGFDGWAEC